MLFLSCRRRCRLRHHQHLYYHCYSYDCLHRFGATLRTLNINTHRASRAAASSEIADSEGRIRFAQCHVKDGLDLECSSDFIRSKSRIVSKMSFKMSFKTLAGAMTAGKHQHRQTQLGRWRRLSALLSMMTATCDRSC